MILGILVKGESFVVPFYVATSVSFVGALVVSISRFVDSNTEKVETNKNNINNNSNSIHKTNNNNNNNNSDNADNKSNDVVTSDDHVNQSSPVLQFLITAV